MKPPGPGWMTIPALTIDGNGNPTFEPEPSDDPKASTPASASATVTSSDSSSQTGSPSGSASRSFVTSFSTSVSSCITTTTEVCSTLTSYGVDASGSTTTTSVASQCSPTVGCSVLASNTASATTSAASGCWEYDFTLDNQEFENEDEQTFQTVDIKAAAHGLDRIGACSFTRTELNPSSMVTVPVTINIPSWPAVSELAAMSTATEWYAATMASDMDGSCPTLTYTTFDSAQSLTASPLMIGVGGVPATYSLDGDKPSVNVDHAYDIALIIEFLEFIMDSQSDTAAYCESFNDFFIGGEGDPGDDDEPRLQTFFNDIARRSPDPVAVDSVLNDVKEKLLANIDGLRGGSDGTKQVGSKNVTMSDSEKLQVLNEIGGALALINDEGTASRFNMTNSAIWASWMAIDNLGVNPGCNAAPLPAPTSGSPGWADAYTSYMNSKLDQQKTAISNHIESIIATQGGWFTQTADNDGNLNLAGRGLEAFKTGYPESKWTMSTDAMLIWQPQPTYTPLGTATCYSPPTDADLSSFSMRFTSELGALSRAGVGTQPYSGRSMATTYPYLCSDGASTGSCWGYDFSTTAAYNSSSISTPSTFSTWFSSFTSGGSWSGNPLTPSPSPTRGSPTASLTSTRPYPTIITRSYPASSSAQSTTWATFSAANSSFVDSSSSWSGQSGTTSTLNPAFPTLPSSSDAQSSNSSSTLNPAFPTLPSSIGTQSGNSSSTTHVETVTATAYESTVVSVSVVHKTVVVPAPWSWYTSLPEATPATSTTSSSESSEASTTAAPPATTAAHPTENGGNPFKLSCGGGEQGMPIAAFDLATANKAIDYTCSAWYDAEGDEDARVYYAMHYGSGMENPIYFHISQQDTGGDCPDLYSQSDRSTAIATCKENFEYIVNTCDTSSNDFYWWKRGGTLIKDCYRSRQIPRSARLLSIRQILAPLR
ncbi:hypothetical protein HDK90DRAFT_88239 [Phyllosticta capitalensis]|uniref:Uncharacterized protein n=1 Tax=Phyllosticta capitalensis TaxID=121624 RepID=A0ABR1YCG5_9PEZI